MASFEEDQRAYYLRSINRALPATSSAGAAATIQAALGVVDPALPAEGRQAMADARNFLADMNPSVDILKRDAECRALPYPSQGMRSSVDDRVGCGWWYTPSPVDLSVGALGTRRGPMSPNLDQYGSGQWIWDPATAYKMESLKRAAKITACEDLPSAAYDNIGWCPTTGMAVITQSATDGTPLYPQSAGGDCPDPVILKKDAPGACVTPSAGGAPAAAGGSQTALCAPMASGGLSPACLQSLIQNSNACSSKGSLYQALSGGYANTSASFNAVNGLVANAGFALDQGFVTGGATTPTRIQQSLQGLAAFASSQTGSRAGSAAANLCYGSTFDPCAMAPSDAGPYDPSCVTAAALKKGFTAQGSAMPANAGMSTWNQQPTWSAVLGQMDSMVSAANTANPAQPKAQAAAIQQVYGLSVKYPKQDCNNFGVLMYRYFFPTWDQTLFSDAGPQTHFLGRYIFKNGFPNVGSTYQDQTPGGGFLTEGQRMVTNYIPQQGGTYIFQINHDDAVRMQITSPDGSVSVLTPGSDGWSPCCGPTNLYPVQLIAGQVYKIVIDFWNGGGPWNFSLTASVNGGSLAPLPLTQLSMTADRRLPFWEIAFNRMPSQSATQRVLADTNGIFQNCKTGAAIGSLNGRQCMLITKPGDCVYNANNYVQGIRLRAMKSFTMMVQINSVTLSSTSTSPTIVSFFNLPESVTTGYPRKGWNPNYNQPYYNRVNDFTITARPSNTIFPWGMGPADAGRVSNIMDFFNQNWGSSGNGVVTFSPGQWFHYAWVWDDDFTGYTVYINGKQAGRAFVPAYDVTLIMEQFRIGCDTHVEGQQWTGGMAWWRAFDYRLSTDLIQTDMNDGWSGLV